MKRSLLLVILFFAATFTYASNPVTQADARLVAKNFLVEITKNTAISLSDITLKAIEKDAQGNAIFYIFNVRNDGFVIISATDMIDPVLGFSVSNKFERNESLDFMFDTYKEELKYAKENNIVITSAPEQWANFTDPAFAPSMVKDGANDVEPMVTAWWDQPKYFNHACPIDGDTPHNDGMDGRAYTGCVAVTMSNFLYYYRYPEYGVANAGYYHPKYGNLLAPIFNHKYDYSSVTDLVKSYQQTVSDLMFHTGVAVQMNYGGTVEEGSGAQSGNVGPRLSSHFGFYPGELVEATEADLVTELDAHRVVYFSGNKPAGAGHAWIVDGYYTSGANKMIHCNWGWSGSSNGFYRLSAIPTYSSNKQMYIRMAPDSVALMKPTVGDTVRLTHFRGNVCDGAGIAGYTLGITRSWIIATPDAESYTLTPRKIKMLADDHVYVYAYRNGNLVNIPVANWAGSYLMPEATGVIGSPFAGTPLPSELNVIADSLLIQFVSGADTSHSLSTEYGRYFTGININYVAKYPTATKQYCPTTMRMLNDVPEGCISDKDQNPDVDPDMPYRAETSCSWRILPGSNHNGIEINFTKFDLKKGDFIDFVAGNNRLKYSFDINNVPQGPFYVAGPYIAIYFNADNVGEGTGFDLCWIGSSKIVDNSGLENIEVYPNPVSDKVTISLNANTAGKINFQIVDLTGRVIRTDVVNHFGGELNHEIYVNDLAKGMYLVRIMTDKGQVTHKIVVE